MAEKQKRRKQDGNALEAVHGFDGDGSNDGRVPGRRTRPWWPQRWLRGDGEATTPSVDVYEEKDDIIVKAELPGMDKSDVEVNISDSELTLKGEKKKEEKVEEENYFRCERSYGAFSDQWSSRRTCRPTRSRPRLRMESWRSDFSRLRRRRPKRPKRSKSKWSEP